MFAYEVVNETKSVSLTAQLLLLWTPTFYKEKNYIPIP